MKNLALLIAACLLFASTADAADKIPPKAHPKSADWDDLFKADLSDAIYPKGVWSLDDDGVLTATKDECIWTEKEYDNFIVDLEFKTAEGTNSGVIVYCSNMDEWIPNSVEVQIADDHAEKWSKMPTSWQCGAVFGHLGACESRVKRPGLWNRFTVTCKDKMIYVMLNGRQVNEFDMSQYKSARKNPDGTDIPAWLSTPLDDLPTKGRVGLQGKHAGAPIYFRNAKVKELKKAGGCRPEAEGKENG